VAYFKLDTASYQRASSGEWTAYCRFRKRE
jgi:hypothetical protein